MKRANPQTLLLILVLVVPLVVACGLVVAFLLLRAGYGLLVGGLVPFVGSMLVIAAIGVFLGRAAGASGRSGGEEPENGEHDDARSRRPNDV